MRNHPNAFPLRESYTLKGRADGKQKPNPRSKTIFLHFLQTCFSSVTGEAHIVVRAVGSVPSSLW